MIGAILNSKYKYGDCFRRNQPDKEKKQLKCR